MTTPLEPASGIVRVGSFAGFYQRFEELSRTLDRNVRALDALGVSR